VLARVFEEAGLSTTALALIRDHAQRAKPPRALFVPFPLGFALGRPNDPPFQHRVLRAAFDLLGAESGPVIADFPEGTDAPAELLQASEAQAGRRLPARPPVAEGEPVGPADEVTALRGYYEQWLADHDGRTMVGLTGITQRRWRGLIRYLEGYAAGSPPWYAELPSDVPLARFLRYAADDLKAFYFEARMARRPDQVDNDLQRWFWTETAMGTLLIRVADRMAAGGDPELTLYAKGIAR
jgi:hypothetical protein